MRQASYPIVFYDSDCLMCEKSIRWLLKKDCKGKLFFAPLRGLTAHQKLYTSKRFDPEIDSVIVLENLSHGENKIFYRAHAISRILWHIGGIWTLAGIFSVLPRPFFYFLDLVYARVAKNRQQIIRGKSSCPVLDQESRRRFLP